MEPCKATPINQAFKKDVGEYEPTKKMTGLASNRSDREWRPHASPDAQRREFLRARGNEAK